MAPGLLSRAMASGFRGRLREIHGDAEFIVTDTRSINSAPIDRFLLAVPLTTVSIFVALACLLVGGGLAFAAYAVFFGPFASR